MKKQTIYNQHGEERILKEIKLNTFSVQLEETQKGVYTYNFQKSLTNIKTESELLPLIADISGLAPSSYTIDNDSVVLKYETFPNSVVFTSFKNKKLHEKLQVLKNVRHIYASFKKGYTHILHPNNLFIDDNHVPYVLYRGYQDVMEPLMQTDDDFIRQYQSLIFSLLDTKYDFEALYNGALEYTKKTAFLEKVYSAKTIEEIAEIVAEAYHSEKIKYEKIHFDAVKSRYRLFRTFGIIGTLATVIFASIIGWMFLMKIPKDERMAKASGYYAAEKYSEVISVLSHDEVSNLPKSHQYMLAKSYLDQEAMSNENKAEAKKVLTYDSDPRVFEFWIKLGRDDYKSAISIAKDLESPSYTYIATFKAVKIISKSTGNGDQKEKDLETYKKEVSKYEEQLKKEKEKEKNNSLPTNETTKTT